MSQLRRFWVLVREADADAVDTALTNLLGVTCGIRNIPIARTNAPSTTIGWLAGLDVEAFGHLPDDARDRIRTAIGDNTLNIASTAQDIDPQARVNAWRHSSFTPADVFAAYPVQITDNWGI